MNLFLTLGRAAPDAKATRRSGRLRALAAGICLAASVAVSAPASASLVQNSFPAGSLNFTVNSPAQAGQSVQAGGFSGVFNGSAFLSYCIELAQQFSFGTTYNSYAAVPVANAPNTFAMGAAKAADLALLVGSYFTGSFASATTTAAFQLAVWEIVYESGNAYNVNAGVFAVTAGNAAALALANTWLGNLGTVSAPIIALTSPTNQDFITVVPVPPSAALFAGGLLFGLWGVRRRRNG